MIQRDTMKETESKTERKRDIERDIGHVSKADERFKHQKQ